MKIIIKLRLSIIIIIGFLGIQDIISQPCDPNGGGIAFYSQDKVDNFAISHPSCNRISGNLLIGPEIHNLNGLSSLVEIGGGLIIEDNTFITTLSGLDNIKSLTGNILIKNCSALINMEGLTNLSKILGSFYIEDCSSLINLSGIENLDTINKSLRIINNAVLQSLKGLSSVHFYGDDIILNNCGKTHDLQGFEGLSQVFGRFSIINNPELDSLKGLKFLTNIKGDFNIINNPKLFILGKDEPGIQYGPYRLSQIGSDLVIKKNVALYNLSGLNGLETINRQLSISENDVLNNITHLFSLEKVTAWIDIRKNSKLINLRGLDLITEAGGVQISLNPSLTSLYGLHNLESVKEGFSLGSNNTSLKIISGGLIPGTSNHRLLKLQTVGGDFSVSYSHAILMLGFYNLKSVGGNMSLSRNSDISIIYDFANLENVGGVLSFSYNTTLAEIQFSKLTYVGGLSIDNNNKFNGIGGLGNLEKIGSEGLLIKEENELLKNLQGLEKLKFIEGDLKLYNSDLRDFSGIHPTGGLSNLDSIGGSLWLDLNRSIFSFGGLQNLKSIGEDLFIHNSGSLVSIGALSQLNKIGGSIDIAQNQYLTSLVGLHNIDYQTIQDLHLSANRVLSGCEVTSICNYLFNNGSADISGNAMNCNSRQEVIEACNRVGVDDIKSLSKIEIAPNPLSDFMGIVSDEYLELKYSIFDVYGHIVYKGNLSSNERAEISHLPSGSYVIRLDLNGEQTYRRFVKE